MRGVALLKPLAALAALVTLAAVLLFAGGHGKHVETVPTPKAPPTGNDPSVAAQPAAVEADDAKGNHWKIVGSAGLELGAFHQPRGVTALADGSFVVVDRKARVQHFDAQGRALDVWSMKQHDLGNPKSLHALPGGNLLVCDTHYGRVLEMTVAGAIVKQWGKSGMGPAEFVHPLACDVDPRAGVAYVAEYGGDNDRIQKFKLDGTWLKAWGSFGDAPGQFRRPSGVAVDAEGRVHVADAANHRIQTFDGEGNVIRVFGELGSGPGQLRFPYDIACGPDDRLYVAEFNNHRVSVFENDGRFVKTIGEAGTGPGQFYGPWSLTVDERGRLFVSDTNNDRMQILKVAEPVQRHLAQALPDR